MKFLENSLVYIIDDEPGIQMILSDLIEEIGVKTKTFSSAIDALENIAADVPDLIISDIKMPEMDGMNFLIKLRGKNINIPVILLSAHISKDVMLNALEVGVYGFVEKPIKEVVFRSFIKNALAKSLFQKSVVNKIEKLKQIADKINNNYGREDNDILTLNNELKDLEGINLSFMRR